MPFPHLRFIGTSFLPPRPYLPLTVGKFAWASFNEVVFTQGECFHPALLTQPD